MHEEVFFPIDVLDIGSSNFEISFKSHGVVLKRQPMA